MRRRDFVKGVGVGLATAAAVSCAQEEQAEQSAAPAKPAKKLKWKMVTTWPKNFPGLGTGAEYLARAINQLSGGRIEVTVYGGGELVPAFEVFDAVSNGTAEMGHGGAYYWKGKAQATQLFGAVPFGMTATEMDGWLSYGGGLDLWRDIYSRFNLRPNPSGHTGVQMGGWFNREINSLGDLSGLKMRIPGLGGEVLKRAGGVPVNRPGGELFNALQTGDIDATEWVGPYNDMAFGLHKAARYYYTPGWHEPDATLECIINLDVYNALPDDLKAVIDYASAAATRDMYAEYTANNNRSLRALIDEHKVEVRQFPDAVLRELKRLSGEVLRDIAADDEEFARVLASYQAFQAKASAWTKLSETAYLKARG